MKDVKRLWYWHDSMEVNFVSLIQLGLVFGLISAPNSLARDPAKKQPNHSISIENHDFPLKHKVQNVELKLNGVGIRNYKTFGMNFKVYAAGLYTQQKSSNGIAIIRSEAPKYLKSFYLRKVSVKKQSQAWLEAIKKNCVVHCEKSLVAVKMLISSLKETKKGGYYNFTFLKDRVQFEMEGEKENVDITIEGRYFVMDLLAVFIGQHPPTKELRKKLLGL